MTKKMMTICDICEDVVENGYVLEMRRDLPENQLGSVERWDLCPECRDVLLAFFNSKKQSDVPIINKV